MFDANLRYLPKGYEFFAEVGCLKDKSPLAKAGIKHGDVILCTMLSIGHDNPRIKVHLPHGQSIRVRHWDEGDEDELLDTFLVFSGNKEFGSFICDKEKAKAKAYLELLESTNGG